MFRMSLYAHPHLRNSGSNFGYAYTYYEIERHLRNFSYNGEKIQLDLNSLKSNVQMYYGSPPGFFFSHQFKINMTQWESTKVPDFWIHEAQKYNEWWTANKFGADAMINSGIPENKVYIYEHGVDKHVWTPYKRGENNKVRFLHVDSGSPRKRSDMAISAFKAAFGDNPNYELTLKYSHYPQTKADWSNYDVLSSQGEWDKNVRHIRENLSLEQLVQLFHFHDALVYPSEGEGFGLIPLQALATGMPVISTDLWCSYKQYFLGNEIYATLGKSHVVESYSRPGDVVLPNLDSLIDQMKRVAENIDFQSNIFYNQIDYVTEEYDWQTKTNDAFNSLVNRIGIESFGRYKGYLK